MGTFPNLTLALALTLTLALIRFSLEVGLWVEIGVDMTGTR